MVRAASLPMRGQPDVCPRVHGSHAHPCPPCMHAHLAWFPPPPWQDLTTLAAALVEHETLSLPGGWAGKRS